MTPRTWAALDNPSRGTGEAAAPTPQPAQPLETHTACEGEDKGLGGQALGAWAGYGGIDNTPKAPDLVLRHQGHRKLGHLWTQSP